MILFLIKCPFSHTQWMFSGTQMTPEPVVRGVMQVDDMAAGTQAPASSVATTADNSATTTTNNSSTPSSTTPLQHIEANVVRYASFTVSPHSYTGEYNTSLPPEGGGDSFCLNISIKRPLVFIFRQFFFFKFSFCPLNNFTAMFFKNFELLKNGISAITSIVSPFTLFFLNNSLNCSGHPWWIPLFSPSN